MPILAVFQLYCGVNKFYILNSSPLNDKVCIGQISGTWEILICKYGRKSMGISEKILTSKS
jgi:hypothetical protein